MAELGIERNRNRKNENKKKAKTEKRAVVEAEGKRGGHCYSQIS